MKAILIEKYGLPEQVLSLKEVARPTPNESEVLIKIRATAVNDYDWSIVRGKPHLYRLMYGLLKPKRRFLGMELAGTIEAVGPNVGQLKVGDSVFGDISNYGFGTFAEYICINENAVKKKPIKVSFEEAAALPHASTLALQALRDMGNIREGQRILINGGGGGVGTIGLQLAKLHNCKVTGVDSLEKLDMMRSIGFDHVIDYKETNFTKTEDQYDLILDCKTNQSAFSYLGTLKPNGKYVTIGGKVDKLIGLLFLGKIISGFSRKRLKILALKPNKDLDYICTLLEQNKIECVIDGPYILEDIPRLIQYFGEGRHKGKIVIKMT